jgi:hypothetical protein
MNEIKKKHINMSSHNDVIFIITKTYTYHYCGFYIIQFTLLLYERRFFFNNELKKVIITKIIVSLSPSFI